MRWIHSRHFQICGIDEYWQIPYVKVSSRDSRQFMWERPRMLTNIRYLPNLAYSPRIGVCVVPPCTYPIFFVPMLLRISLAETLSLKQVLKTLLSIAFCVFVIYYISFPVSAYVWAHRLTLTRQFGTRDEHIHQFFILVHFIYVHFFSVRIHLVHRSHFSWLLSPCSQSRNANIHERSQLEEEMHKVSREYINNLRCVNDMVLIAKNTTELEDIAQELIVKCRKALPMQYKDITMWK